MVQWFSATRCRDTAEAAALRRARWSHPDFIGATSHAPWPQRVSEELIHVDQHHAAGTAHARDTHIVGARRQINQQSGVLALDAGEWRGSSIRRCVDQGAGTAPI